MSLVKENVANRDNLDVYTFGSPRVGNRDFAYAYDRVSGSTSITTDETVKYQNQDIGESAFYYIVV